MAVYHGTDIGKIAAGLANGLLVAMAAGSVPSDFAGGYLAALDSVCLAVGAESRFLLDQFGNVPVEHYEPPRIGAPVEQTEPVQSSCSSGLESYR